MQLTREAIQRMCGSISNNAGGGGGGFDPSILAGYATESWVNDNYISIEFFSSLFKAYDSNGNEILPNDTDSTIDNIKAMFGFWTDQYLSALGQNSGGGGGTVLTEPLESINNASLGTPSQSGVAIMWNGSAWTYQVPGGGSGGGGTVTSVGLTMPTGFSVSGQPVTGSGTIAITFANGYALPLTADVNKGVSAYNSLSNYLPKAGGTMTGNLILTTGIGIMDSNGAGLLVYKPSSGWTAINSTQWGVGATDAQGIIRSNNTDLQHYKSNASYKIYDEANIHTANAGSATKLQTARTLWGQSFDGTDNVTGSLSDVDSITTLTGGNLLGFKMISLNYPSGSNSNGGEILFHFSRISSTTSRIVEDASGRIFLDASSGVRIGDGVLVWDSTNNALKVQKNDGTAANFYALGAVSALGFSAGDGTATMDRVNIGNANQYVGKGNISGTDILNIVSNTTIMLSATNGVAVNGNLSSFTGTWLIGTIGGDANSARFSRLYLDNSRYLYLNNGVLYFYNGSASKQVAFIN